MNTQYYFYCLTSAYIASSGQRKLGVTIHPHHRLRTYNTGDPPGIGLDKHYEGLWRIQVSSVKELLSFEKTVHEHFTAHRKFRAHGASTEWFQITFQDVETFLNAQYLTAQQLTFAEIVEIHRRSELSSISSVEVQEEMQLIQEQQEHFIRKSLQDTFFETFLPGKLPRRIQQELWSLFEQKCDMNQPYRGIVQWVTGVGKTIAFLMMLVQSANHCKKQGLVFRGLLVAPKNDIFDTIMPHIRKLSNWGITVYEGHNAQMSSLVIPHNKPVLITATHAALTEETVISALPPITHLHYDEVHRITGNEFFDLLIQHLDTWKPMFVTGTSATPKTCMAAQNKKLMQLFGDPLQILHKCDVEEAIENGWIAQPRFTVHVVSNDIPLGEVITNFVHIVQDVILKKQEKGFWKGSKVIAYLPTREAVRVAVNYTQRHVPSWIVYSAVEDTQGLQDSSFITDRLDGKIQCLYACERYREGADIPGLEMTAILMGDSIASNVLLQVAGRALRKDYEGKEGWCVIVRPSPYGTTEDDVFESVMLQIMEFVGKDEENIPSISTLRRRIASYFGDVIVRGKVYDVEETAQRIQSMFLQQRYSRANTKEKYDTIRALNQSMNLQSKYEYESRAAEHSKFIANPKMYFADNWISWYHFLGVSIDMFPHTKSDFKVECVKRGVSSWDDYKARQFTDMPPNPGEMYEDWTNPTDEFPSDDEIIW